MKTKTLSTLVVAALMAMGTTVMPQDSTTTKGNTTRSRMQQKVPKMMKKMDTNGDGTISMDEARAAKGQKLYKNFKGADTSRDGMIDPKEFMAYRKGMKKDRSMRDRDPMKKKDSTDHQ